MDAAIETHLLARELSAESGDVQIAALVTYNLGCDHLDKRDYAAVEQFSRLTLELLEEKDDQTLRSRAYSILGQACRERGDHERSIDYHTRALAINRVVGSATRLARSLTEMAADLRAADRPDEAVAYYQEARELLSTTTNELDKTLINISLGGAYFEMGQWSLAEKAMREADSDYLRQSGDVYYRAFVTVSLGNVLLKQGRFVEAEATLRRSVKLWE